MNLMKMVNMNQKFSVNSLHLLHNFNKKYEPISGFKNFEKILKSKLSSKHELLKQENLNQIEATSLIFPFRTNNYIVNELIDWNNIPNDPLYQTTFPQPGMLDNDTIQDIIKLLKPNNNKNQELKSKIEQIRKDLNPFGGEQEYLNIPQLPKNSGNYIDGCMHKYNETVVFFPTPGQFCHGLCTYCFRWPLNLPTPMKFEEEEDYEHHSDDITPILKYISTKPKVTDLLFTGGDAGFLKYKHWKSYLEPIINNTYNTNLKNIRVCSKSLTYHPYRWISNKDTSQLLKLFERASNSGIKLNYIAHLQHSNEMKTLAFEKAISNLKNVGFNIFVQSAIIPHINADYETIQDLLKNCVNHGLTPYYIFQGDNYVHQYFDIPFAETLKIYKKAIEGVTGLCRTVRGPIINPPAGKVMIEGVSNIGDEKVFVLKFSTGRKRDWVGKLFYAKYDENVKLFEDLEPMFLEKGEKEWFFIKEMKEMFPKRYIPVVKKKE